MNLESGDHLLHVYPHDDGLLDTLAPFVSAGLAGGESTVVIATPAHLAELERRLTESGYDLLAARRSDQYIPLRADWTLSRFMVLDWPDENRFQEVAYEVLARAQTHGRPVRAFGEMVALLWGKGQHGATLRLEQLWNNLCRAEQFSLLCAYPAAAFAGTSAITRGDIDDAHTRNVQAA